jgi:hypothetical protein
MAAGQLVVVKDVDGDDKNEVVAIFGWATDDSTARQIRCYSFNKTLKWQYEVHKSVSIDGNVLNDDFRVTRMMVGDFDRDGKTEVIGVASHIPWSPSVIVRLDAKTGKLMGEYLHHGRLEASLHTDLDGDGVEDLLFGGINHPLDQAVLVVLDPRQITGETTIPESHKPGSMEHTVEKAYVLFPKIEFPAEYSDLRCFVTEVALRSDGLVQVGVTAGMDKGGRPVGLSFFFDKSLECLSATSGDGLQKLLETLAKEGQIKSKPDSAYFRALTAGVEYWDGVNFGRLPVIREVKPTSSSR